MDLCHLQAIQFGTTLNGDARNLIRSYHIFEGQGGPTDLF